MNKAQGMKNVDCLYLLYLQFPACTNRQACSLFDIFIVLIIECCCQRSGNACSRRHKPTNTSYTKQPGPLAAIA